MTEILRSSNTLGLQQFIQIYGFKLPAGHDLLQRRQFKNNSEYCRHRTMIGKCLAIKYKILEGSFFDRL